MNIYYLDFPWIKVYSPYLEGKVSTEPTTENSPSRGPLSLQEQQDSSQKQKHTSFPNFLSYFSRFSFGVFGLLQFENYAKCPLKFQALSYVYIVPIGSLGLLKIVSKRWDPLLLFLTNYIQENLK